jgi:hypothetical protein
LEETGIKGLRSTVTPIGNIWGPADDWTPAYGLFVVGPEKIETSAGSKILRAPHHPNFTYIRNITSFLELFEFGATKLASLIPGSSLVCYSLESNTSRAVSESSSHSLSSPNFFDSPNPKYQATPVELAPSQGNVVSDHGVRSSFFVEKRDIKYLRKRIMSLARQLGLWTRSPRKSGNIMWQVNLWYRGKSM